MQNFKQSRNWLTRELYRIFELNNENKHRKNRPHTAHYRFTRFVGTLFHRNHRRNCWVGFVADRGRAACHRISSVLRHLRPAGYQYLQDASATEVSYEKPHKWPCRLRLSHDHQLQIILDDGGDYFKFVCV